MFEEALWGHIVEKALQLIMLAVLTVFFRLLPIFPEATSDWIELPTTILLAVIFLLLFNYFKSAQPSAGRIQPDSPDDGAKKWQVVAKQIVFLVFLLFFVLFVYWAFHYLMPGDTNTSSAESGSQIDGMSGGDSMPGGSGRECKRLNKTDHNDVSEDLLLRPIIYYVGSVRSEVNLVEELAEENCWRLVADQTDFINPETIHDKYKETKEELIDSSRKLFKKIRKKGYHGKLGWDAHIEGLKNTGNKRVVADLESILKCLGISRTDPEEVTRQRFEKLECEGKKLSLVIDMAEEWRSIAREYGIPKHTIFSDRNIPKACAEEVLTKLRNHALSWQEIIKIMYDAELKLLTKRLERAIENYCVKD